MEGSVLTAPMIFAGAGWLVGAGGLGLVHVDVNHSTIHMVAELTLILILFCDAARIKLRRVQKDHNLPVRMLLIGLPLTIALGTLVASTLFSQLSLWEAALLAALLAPTDAALGQAVVTAKAVPIRIRQSINIESGLNDGIALPVVLLFAALAGTSGESQSSGDWFSFGLLQIGLGPLVGAAVGYAGARLLDASVDGGWSTHGFQAIGALALSILAYAVADLVGGNGFISAFVAGVLFGNCIRHECEYLFEFMESEGHLFMLLTFLFFGAALLPEAMQHFDVKFLLYALLSLTVIRMLPIAVSLLGSGIRLPTYGFLGWFGPRGLASILFLLLILEQSETAHRADIVAIAVLTVALSILLHGATATPFARAYGRLTDRMGECEERKEVSVLPLRKGAPRR